MDAPLSIISPTVVKKITPTRKKTTDDGEEKKTKSLRLARKVHQTTADSKSLETTKLTKKQKKDETNTEEETDVGNTLQSKCHVTLPFRFRKNQLLQVKN
jgi:hypothetical protein